jgi:hypothetical protein
MRSKLAAAAVVIMSVSLCCKSVLAQADAPKAEAGVQSSLLRVDRVSGKATEPGVGGRLTYNVTDSVGVETELNFFPKKDGATNQEGGRITEGLFGVRIGKRSEKVGVFGKARPGFVSFGRAILNRDARVTNAFNFQYGRLTHFAFDLGGVVELYPSRRTVVRFDIGDTIIRYGRQNFIDALGQTAVVEGFTRHNLQFGAGVGFRF